MDDPNMHVYGEAGPDDAEIGRQWRENSSLEKWFPITAEQLAAKERENLHLAREARTWWEAAQTYAKSEAKLTEALGDLLAAHAMRASCQAGMVERCKCVPCATARAREVLGPNAKVTGPRVGHRRTG